MVTVGSAVGTGATATRAVCHCPLNSPWLWASKIPWLVPWS